MRWNKSILLSVLFLITAVGFTVLKLEEANYLREQYPSVSIRFKTEGVTEDFIKAALVNEKKRGSERLPEITAWSQLSEAKIWNRSLNRYVQVRIVLVTGDMSLTAPMTLKFGNFIYQNDFKGCVIDSYTAFKLYGTEKAVGNRLLYQGRYYYIRGVVKTTDPLLLLQEKDSTKEYSNLEVVYQNREQGQALAENFLLQNNFPQNNVVIDGYFCGRMLQALLILPIWLFFVAIGFGFMKSLWKKKQDLKLHKFLLYGVIALFIIIGYGCLLYQFLGTPFYVPDKLIPTKFSDFDYWGEQYRLWKEQMKQLQFLMPNQKDIFLEKEIVRAPFNFIIMILLYIIFSIHIRFSRRITG
jgi:hypothetical protein